jgi:tetratricopeptide (TPR) repeat protein
MARSFLSFTLALAAATLILFGAGATRALAQPTPSGSGSTATPPVEKKYPEVGDAFQYLVNTRDMPTTIKKLKEAVRQYPELPSEYVLMFQFLAQQLNQPAAAKFQLEVGVHVYPNDPDNYVILGSIAMQERRVAEATMDFEKAQQLLTKYTNEKRKPALDQQVLSGIASVAEANEDWKGAELRLQDLLIKAPKDLSVHQRLAKAMFKQGKGNDAYKILKAAKEIDHEKFLQPEAIMAQLFDQSDLPDAKDKAKEWFDASLKWAPDDLAVRQVVSIWALENGKLDFAKKQADEALRIEGADKKKFKDSNVGHMLRGYVALWEKKWPEAEQNFKNVMDNDPSNFVAKNNIALALCEQDDPAKKERALKYAEGNYKENNKSPDALSTLGWVNFRCGKFGEAGAYLDAALKATGGNLNNPDTATYVAYILHHRQQDWDAKNILAAILVEKARPFAMKPEAKELYEKVKDAVAPKKPEDASKKPDEPPKKP